MLEDKCCCAATYCCSTTLSEREILPYLNTLNIPLKKKFWALDIFIYEGQKVILVERNTIIFSKYFKHIDPIFHTIVPINTFIMLVRSLTVKCK